MAKVNQQPPRAPLWPWGGPRSVRDRLVEPRQLDTRKTKKKGDPKNPSLASAALLDFIGYFLEHITTEVRRFAANRIRAVAYTGDNSVERVADKFVDVSGSTGKFAVGCSAEALEALLQVDHQILDCRDLFGG